MWIDTNNDMSQKYSCSEIVLIITRPSDSAHAELAVLVFDPISFLAGIREAELERHGIREADRRYGTADRR